MEVTPTRKLLSYFVSFILLFFCKDSYDVHHQRIEMQNQPVFVQPEKPPLPIETVSPQEQNTEPLQSGKLPDLYIVKDGKTEQSTTEDPESENDAVKSSPKN